MKRLAIVMFAVSLDFAMSGASAVDEPGVTPYRPTVSTPASLSEPGWLELELGGQRTRGGDSARRDSTPYTLKYAFTPDWGVRVGGDAWIRELSTDGFRVSGFGDTAVIGKRRFARSETSAFGLEGGVNFPTAKDGLGSGKADYLLNGIHSADWGVFHTDINLGMTLLLGKIR